MDVHEDFQRQGAEAQAELLRATKVLPMVKSEMNRLATFLIANQSKLENDFFCVKRSEQYHIGEKLKLIQIC